MAGLVGCVFYLILVLPVLGRFPFLFNYPTKLYGREIVTGMLIGVPYGRRGSIIRTTATACLQRNSSPGTVGGV